MAAKLDADAMYAIWRWDMWLAGLGTYEQIEAKVADGRLTPFHCPKSDCGTGCHWKHAQSPSDAGTSQESLSG